MDLLSTALLFAVGIRIVRIVPRQEMRRVVIGLSAVLTAVFARKY